MCLHTKKSYLVINNITRLEEIDLVDLKSKIFNTSIIIQDKIENDAEEIKLFLESILNLISCKT